MADLLKRQRSPDCVAQIVHVGGPTVSVPGPPGGLESIVEFCSRFVGSRGARQAGTAPFDIPSLIGVEVDRYIPQVRELITMQEQPVEHEHCVRRKPTTLSSVVSVGSSKAISELRRLLAGTESAVRSRCDQADANRGSTHRQRSIHAPAAVRGQRLRTARRRVSRSESDLDSRRALPASKSVLADFRTAY